MYSFYKTVILLLLFIFGITTPVFGQNFQEAKSHFDAAQSSFNNQRYNESLNSIARVERILGKTNPRLSSLKVKIYFAQKKYNEAKNELNVLFRLTPDENLKREMTTYYAKIDQAIAGEQNKIRAARVAKIKQDEANKLAANRRQQVAKDKAEKDRKTKVKSDFYDSYLEWELISENRSAYDVISTKDGGGVIVGDISYNGEAHSSFHALKFNSAGKKVWGFAWGAGNKIDEKAFAVTQAQDGGYLVVGRADNYLWVVKTNSQGKMLWNKKYKSGEGNDYSWSGTAYDVTATNDGGFVIVGDTLSDKNSSMDMWILKINAKGKKKWSRTYGEKKQEAAKSVVKTKDGGFLVVGNAGSSSQKTNMLVHKLDAKGKKQWSKAYGGNNNDFGESVIATRDGGYLLAGVYNLDSDVAQEAYPYSPKNIWAVKINSLGATQWSKTYTNGGSLSNVGVGGIAQDRDGGYLLAGFSDASTTTTHEDVWIIKIDNTGIKQYELTYSGKNESYDGRAESNKATSIAATADGGFLVASNSLLYRRNRNAFNVKILKIKAPANTNTRRTTSSAKTTKTAPRRSTTALKSVPTISGNQPASSQLYGKAGLTGTG